jgi:hypothetical protein
MFQQSLLLAVSHACGVSMFGRSTRSSDTVGRCGRRRGAKRLCGCILPQPLRDNSTSLATVTQAVLALKPSLYSIALDRPIAQGLQQHRACVVSQFSESLAVCTPAPFLVTALRVRWPEKRGSYQNCLSARVMAVSCLLSVGMISVSASAHDVVVKVSPKRASHFRACSSQDSTAICLSSISQGFKVH